MSVNRKKRVHKRRIINMGIPEQCFGDSFKEIGKWTNKQ